MLDYFISEKVFPLNMSILIHVIEILGKLIKKMFVVNFGLENTS